MKKTVGIFAHVDAGKTTFSEQLLFKTNTIRTVGRVDKQNTFLDAHEVEKRRGITIFSDQAMFDYNDNHYYLIDTPGHVDFSSEMERAIGIIDYAVIIISGIDGIESHTETVYELLEAACVPVFFFINKMDQGHADLDQVLAELKNTLCPTALDFTSEDLDENISAYDDVLLEHYFNGDYEEKLWHRRTVDLIKKREVMPVFYGSALKDVGIDLFLEKFDLYTETKFEKEPVACKVYKIKYDVKGIRNTYLKLFSGNLSNRDLLGEEKITQIRLHNGSKFKAVDTVSAGDVFSVVGSQKLKVGDTFSMEKGTEYQMKPTLKSKLKWDKSIAVQDLLKSIRQLEEEDPSLNVNFIEESKDIEIGIMGVIQIEILTEIIKKRFNYDVSFEEPNIIYKETISNEVIGCGHFEPLRHYAEVILKISKGPRGSGLVFESECSTDDLSRGHQNLIQHHIFEKDHKGILTGSHLVDLKLTLLTGRGHNEYTSGGDFRQATIRAIRQGLEQADNVLLEPIYTAKITIPKAFMGRVLTDITKAYGEAEAPQQIGDKVIITAKVPVGSFMDYSKELSSFTSGKGRIRLTVSTYRVCHNTSEIIEKMQYDKTLDTAYPSSSVFCKKGKGYTIKWDQAKDYMHCL